MVKTRKFTNDLCKKTKLCKGNMGIPRVKMPQFDEKVTKTFLSYLKKNGVKVKKINIDVRKLKPMQNQLNGDAINNMKKKYKQGMFNINKQTILVSKNNYIIDGHHRWGTLRSCLDNVNECINKNNTFNSKISTYQINLTPLKIIKLSKSFKIKYNDINTV